MDPLDRIADALERIATALESQPADGKLLTVADVAKRLKASRDTVRQWIASGQLPAADKSRNGGRPIYAIAETDIEAFLDLRKARDTKPPKKSGGRLVTRTQRY